MSLLHRMLDMNSLAVLFLDSEHCSVASGGSQPIKSPFGVKPVVEFQLLL
jgi:hypothetical protein